MRGDLWATEAMAQYVIDEYESHRYTNDPLDSGGPTKYGVTLKTLRRWRGRRVTADDVQALTREEAVAIFVVEYFKMPGLDRLDDPGVSFVVFDWGITSGPATAIKALQRIVGAEVDGILGPQTAGHANAHDPAPLIGHLSAARVQYYTGIVRRKPDQIRFLAGWANRAARALDLAVED